MYASAIPDLQVSCMQYAGEKVHPKHTILFEFWSCMFRLQLPRIGAELPNLSKFSYSAQASARSPTVLAELKMSKGWREVERNILRLLHGRNTRTRLTEIHAHFVRHHLHQSNQLLSHFVSVCGAFGKMPYAELVFCQTENPNIFLFNSMIKGYSLCGPFKGSIHLFSTMRNRGIWPDEFTFVPLLKSCANLGELSLGQGVHGEVLVLGFDRFSSIRIGVVELYTSCGRMDEAKKVFDEMSQRDVIVWNLMVQGFCKSGDVQMGLQIFRQMGERSVVSWNSIISCLAQCGRDREALELFHEMRNDGFEPDEATVVTALPVCARLGEVNVGRWIHSYAVLSGLYQGFISVGNSLIDFYCKCGILVTALNVFKDMQRKNIVTWNAMISGLAFNGEGELGIGLFEEMMNQGISPNDTTFVGILSCCSHAGLLQKGHNFFASLISDKRVNLKLEHYGCVVDLLGRSGCLKEAYELISTMPMKPNAALWGSLLSACRTHNDMEIAESAVKELINLEPWNPGNYVLLSNMYAERGKWDEVEKVRLSMRNHGVLKAPGQSSVGIETLGFLSE